MTAPTALPTTFNAARALRLAHETLDTEAAAILGLKARVNQGFAQTVQLMLNVRGRVVVMGMGTSGHVGRKIAATLASTGTPAFCISAHSETPRSTASRSAARTCSQVRIAVLMD